MHTALGLIIVLALLGFAMSMFPMDATVKKVLIFLIVVLAVACVLSLLGLWPF